MSNNLSWLQDRIQSAFSIAAIDAVLETRLPFWIGISAKTHKNRRTLSVASYEEFDFADLVKSISRYPAMIMNVMHTVHDVDEAVKFVKQYWNSPVDIYPESGYFTMPNWQFIDVIKPDKLANNAQHWIHNGITLVGGCCGLGSEHISSLRAALHQ